MIDLQHVTGGSLLFPSLEMSDFSLFFSFLCKIFQTKEDLPRIKNLPNELQMI
jgi:hypothetical protein